MKSYKIKSFGDIYLLLQCNKDEYSTTVIDKGRDYETLRDGLIIGIEKEEDSYTYYLADEETQVLSKIADNICRIRSFTDKNLGEIALYQCENNFTLLKLDSLEKIDLGSWFESGYFLFGKKGDMKACFFLNGIFTERTYVSADFLLASSVHCHSYAAALLRKDGLYDIFSARSDGSDIEDALEIEEVKDQYVRLGTDEYDSDMCRMFYYDEALKGYCQIFEGENRIDFANAVLEVIEPAEKEENSKQVEISDETNGQDSEEEKTHVLLYLFEGTEKILLAQTETADYDGVEWDFHNVTVGAVTWTSNDDNSYLLEREPINAEEETEDNQEDNSFDDGLKDNTEHHAEPEKKKSSIWSRLGNAIGWP